MCKSKTLQKSACKGSGTHFSSASDSEINTSEKNEYPKQSKSRQTNTKLWSRIWTPGLGVFSIEKEPKNRQWTFCRQASFRGSSLQFTWNTRGLLQIESGMWCWWSSPFSAPSPKKHEWFWYPLEMPLDSAAFCCNLFENGFEIVCVMLLSKIVSELCAAFQYQSFVYASHTKKARSSFLPASVKWYCWLIQMNKIVFKTLTLSCFISPWRYKTDVK